MCRERDLRAAVLAVDPTSPYTGGALLGDRVRMQEHATDPDVFIRSMATRGHLGGMALAAPEAVRILDAAGYERVVVETVGVGQAEVDVAAATDTAVVVLAPGMGDAVQMAKAGILEVADLFVVNKADRDGAHEVVRELRQMLHLGAARDWDPPVLTATAVDGDGVEDLWEAIESHRTHLAATGALDAKRRSRLLREVEALAAERFRSMATDALEADEALAGDLVDRRIDPYARRRYAGSTCGRVAAPVGDPRSRRRFHDRAARPSAGRTRGPIAHVAVGGARSGARRPR